MSSNSSATMRGASVSAFGGPENIKIANDLPAPKITNPNQVLIDVRAAGVNPVDTYIRAGTFHLPQQPPYTPGVDGAGVVSEVGTAVTHLQVGDRVWFFTICGGATAEIAVAEHAFLLPKGFSFSEGACIGIPYTVAYRALFTKGHIKEGDRVLVHGASGGVGLAACQLAAFAGAALVVGTAGTQQGMEPVRRNGAHHVVNHREENYVEKLKEISPEGFDLIIEMAAAVNMPVDLELLTRGGRVGIVGRQGPVSITPADFKQIYSKELIVYGLVAYGATRDDLFECAKVLARLFSETKYRPICSKTYTLEETAQCHRDLRDESLPTVGNRVVVVKE